MGIVIFPPAERELNILSASLLLGELTDSQLPLNIRYGFTVANFYLFKGFELIRYQRYYYFYPEYGTPGMVFAVQLLLKVF
jgi:hypothetical protein